MKGSIKTRRPVFGPSLIRRVGGLFERDADARLRSGRIRGRDIGIRLEEHVHLGSEGLVLDRRKDERSRALSVSRRLQEGLEAFKVNLVACCLLDLPEKGSHLLFVIAAKEGRIG